MSEKIKAVNNPLTIIAIFAGISEIALIYAFTKCPLELQSVFMWFVMGFPTLLLLLFFGVLIFKHRVLYAPSDFKNEENFIIAMKGVQQVASIDLDKAYKSLEEIKNQVEVTTKQIGAIGEQERIKIAETVKGSIESVQAQIISTKDTLLEATSNKDFHLFSSRKIQNDILLLLYNAENKQMYIKEVWGKLLTPTNHFIANLNLLKEDGFVFVEDGLITLTDTGRHKVDKIKRA